MKRFVLFTVFAFVLCLGAGLAAAQGWAPGLPVSPLPPPGMPTPIGPGYGPAPCPPVSPMPPCGPIVCGPVACGPVGSGGGIAGWQLNGDFGSFKLSSHGAPVLGMFINKLDFKLDGAWLGASGRIPLSCGLRGRAEGRYFIPSEEKCRNDVATIDGFVEAHRDFRSRYSWYILDGSGALDFAPGFSAVGGLRYEYFGVHLNNPPTVLGFSNSADEGDFKVGFIKPYIGFEFALTSCENGLLVRGIGSPWINAAYKYGMTYDMGGPLRASTNGTSSEALFYELYVQVGRRISDKLSVGAFGMINSTCFHGSSDFEAILLPAGLAAIAEDRTFDSDFSRRYFVIGGNVAISFRSFL